MAGKDMGELAQDMKVSKQRLTTLAKALSEGSGTLVTLRKICDSLQCSESDLFHEDYFSINAEDLEGALFACCYWLEHSKGEKVFKCVTIPPYFSKVFFLNEESNAIAMMTEAKGTYYLTYK